MGLQLSPDDIATELEIIHREESIERKRTAERVLAPIGRCYACQKAFDDERRFCDAECRDDYEFFKSADRRNNGH